MEDWLEPGLRFLHYALLLGLFGWTAFRVIGLRELNCQQWGNGFAVAMVGAVLAPLVSLVLMLTSIAAMMGQPLAALEGPMVEAMIFGTDLGWAFLFRAALLGGGLIALLLRNRLASALPIAALCYAAALITLAWSGHAAATEGGLGLFHRLNDGLHLLAAGLWLGAIGWFLHLVIKAHRRNENAQARNLLGVMHRFAPLGVTLVSVVAITGLINAQLIFGITNSVCSADHRLWHFAGRQSWCWSAACSPSGRTMPGWGDAELRQMRVEAIDSPLRCQRCVAVLSASLDWRLA